MMTSLVSNKSISEWNCLQPWIGQSVSNMPGDWSSAFFCAMNAMVWILINVYTMNICNVPSRTGLASRICCSIQECCPLTAARNWRMSLVDSVLPAPLSPL